MKKSILKGILILILMLLFCGLTTEVLAQNPGNKDASLTIPWDDFRNLLNLDKDQILIPLETFQKLLAQTGTMVPPIHSVQGGNVILSRDEFIKLVNQMQAPSLISTTLPFDFLVTKAMYSGKILDGGSSFTANFVVHVLRKNTYLRVPILPLSMGLENVTINGVQTLVVSDNGYHSIILAEPGEYNVTATFSLKSQVGSGPNKIDFSILPTPITLLKFDIPQGNLDVEIPQAQKMQVSSVGKVTSVTAVLSQGSYVSIRWRNKTTITEKIPPKLYAELNHLISIEDDALKVSTDINLNILYSEINEVQLAIPANMNILSVSGEGVGEWQETTKQGRHQLRIPFTYGKKGSVWLRVMLETALTESGLTNEFSGIQVLDAVRETGFMGIELNTSAEVIIAESKGLEPVAVQKLPMQLINQSTKPLMFGFKNLKQPYSLIMDIKKHTKVAVPMATISSANVVTLFTEDGKIVNRLIYQVRNNAKQFLIINVPSDADVWSVFVDGKPVESSMDSDGRLLVPLIRSRVNGEQLETFPVELIYCTVKAKFAWLNSRESSLPAVDLLVSQLFWSVYLPNDYNYHRFTSTLEMEEMIRTMNILSTRDRRYNEEAMRELSQVEVNAPAVAVADQLKKAYEGKELGSTFKNVPMKDDEILRQFNAELEFGGRMERLAMDAAQGAISGGQATGVLPIQIRIPTNGQVYRFAKTIIKPEDPLSFKVAYSRSWVAGAFKWILGMILALVLFIMRRTFSKPMKWIGQRISDLANIYQRNRKTIDKFVRSPMAPLVFLGLAFVSWPFPLIFALIFVLLFWITASYQGIEFWKKRMLVKATVQSGSKETGLSK